MDKQKKLTIIVLLSVFAFFPVAVSAQEEVMQTQADSSSSTTTSTSGARAQIELLRKFTEAQRQQVITELRNKAAQERCTIVTSNVDRRITYYDENYDLQLGRFKSLRNRINQAVSRLESLGLNVTDLRTDATELSSMITEFEAIRTELIAKMGEAKQSACSQTTGEFKAKVQEAEVIVTQLRGKSREIKAFLENDIKESFEAAKPQATTSSAN
jgi:hypothetical protein